MHKQSVIKLSILSRVRIRVGVSAVVLVVAVLAALSLVAARRSKPLHWTPLLSHWKKVKMSLETALGKCRNFLVLHFSYRVLFQTFVTDTEVSLSLHFQLVCYVLLWQDLALLLSLVYVINKKRYDRDQSDWSMSIIVNRRCGIVSFSDGSNLFCSSKPQVQRS